MKTEEFINHFINGERVFNNGSKRIRYVVSFDGLYVYYKTKPGSNQTTGEFAPNFIRWAKGIGEIAKTN